MSISQDKKKSKQKTTARSTSATSKGPVVVVQKHSLKQVDKQKRKDKKHQQKQVEQNAGGESESDQKLQTVFGRQLKRAKLAQLPPLTPHQGTSFGCPSPVPMSSSPVAPPTFRVRRKTTQILEQERILGLVVPSGPVESASSRPEPEPTEPIQPTSVPTTVGPIDVATAPCTSWTGWGKYVKPNEYLRVVPKSTSKAPEKSYKQLELRTCLERTSKVGGNGANGSGESSADPAAEVDRGAAEAMAVDMAVDSDAGDIPATQAYAVFSPQGLPRMEERESYVRTPPSIPLSQPRNYLTLTLSLGPHTPTSPPPPPSADVGQVDGKVREGPLTSSPVKSQAVPEIPDSWEEPEEPEEPHADSNQEPSEPVAHDVAAAVEVEVASSSKDQPATVREPQGQSEMSEDHGNRHDRDVNTSAGSAGHDDGHGHGDNHGDRDQGYDESWGPYNHMTTVRDMPTAFNWASNFFDVAVDETCLSRATMWELGFVWDEMM